MASHLAKIFEDLDELIEMDAALDDKTAVTVILASLNEEYDGLITALEAWDKEKLTIRAVKIKLLEEYARKTVNHGRMNQRVIAKKSQEIECFFCKSKGHIKIECLK